MTKNNLTIREQRATGNANSFQSYLDALHQQYVDLDSGEVASYIPELLRSDPKWFGIALVTVDGHVYQVGESRQSFTIQSISKAITYGMALEDNGVEAVLRKVDVEPSGEAFNSISLEPGTGRPRNPMINAGAIATVALLKGATPEEKFSRMLKCYERYLARPVCIDEAVYRSEKATGHRNRAIAYLLHNSAIIEKETDETLDVYFKQCSLLVTCRDLAIIGATLANNGVNPITGVRALESNHVARVLSVMSSCGMYDYSGAWVYEVGMPAKSGVGGGIVAVLPGQFGLAVFSPKLDDRGNSVRGIAICKKISSDFGLHMFHTSRVSASTVIHVMYDASNVSSKRNRIQEHMLRLKDLGHQVVVLELQGDLIFASAEIVISEATRVADPAVYLVLDFRRVAYIDEGAINLLLAMIEDLQGQGRTILLTGMWNKHLMERMIMKRFPRVDESPLLRCDDLDMALEWCEDQLLSDETARIPYEVPLETQSALEGFSDSELQTLEAMLERRTYEAGVYLCHEGDPADSLYFIVTGQVSVSVPLANRRAGRISTISAGSMFGEMALLDRGKRSADVVVDVKMTCLVLKYSQLEEQANPLVTQIRLKLVTNIARVLTYKLRQATLEVKSLRN